MKLPTVRCCCEKDTIAPVVPLSKG